MTPATVLALAFAAGASGAPTYGVGVTRYFASPAVVGEVRASLMAGIDRFAADAAYLLACSRCCRPAIACAAGCTILRVHVRAAVDTGDLAATAADDARWAPPKTPLSPREPGVLRMGGSVFDRFVAAVAVLAAWRPLFESDLDAPGASLAGVRAVAVLARRRWAAWPTRSPSCAAPQAAPRVAFAPAAAVAAFRAKWTPWQANAPAFAALLVPSVTIQVGRLQGYADAAAVAHASQGLTGFQVQAVLAAVRGSAAWADYTTLVASDTARRFGLAPEGVAPW